MPSLSEGQAKEQVPGKDLEWAVIVKMNREMIVGGTTAIKGRKCMDIKGRKSGGNDCRENTGLGGLGWERGSKKEAHGLRTSKRR